MNSFTRVAIALGSNLGDRRAHLEAAVARLKPLMIDIAVSPLHQTAPVNVPGSQPDFLNAVAVGRTTLDARSLLAGLQKIEAEQGRVRPFQAAPRTLDLDLVLYGNAMINEPGLTVPHPRFRERLFVLEPLTEIAPDFLDPVTSMTAAELLAQLRQAPQAPIR